ncbi:MAG: thioredoxin family protein [Mollicutes bacterium]|nr:thioredoxin family protein [Mollicutes bacterium]
MKKMWLLLPLIALLLCGCEKEIKPFKLDEKYYNKKDVINTNANDFNKLVTDKKSFVLFVYMSGCISCSDFDKVLADFLEENNITIYKISYSDIIGTFLEDKILYAPSLVLFDKGKLVAYLDAISKKDLPFYESSEGLTKWFTKYVEVN